MIIYHDDAYYASRRPEEDLGPLQNFARFIWNGERRTFLDRTLPEWGEVGIFYAFFFAVLFALFFLQIFLTVAAVANLDKPYFHYMDLSTRALFGMKIPFQYSSWNYRSPGMGNQPTNPQPRASAIIWVNNSNTSGTSGRYIRSLTDFLDEYNRNSSDYNTQCNDDSKLGYKAKPCFFDTKSLGACSRPPYGYKKPLRPCVFLKFNKGFDWVPHYYNQSSELPREMPGFLKAKVKESKQFRIWLSCDGANNVDKDHIGEIDYIPGPGFPVQFFPFSGQADYLSPIVALRFNNLTPNRLVTVQCALWAFNIHYHSREFLYFQMLIDPRT